MIALALVLALQQDAVLDVPVYQDAAWRVSLPRPFDDWLFAPATERGTTTVIFQPRAGSLSDQLWGVLVLTRWGAPVRIGEVADRRISGTWRPTLGPSFRLLSRDSTSVLGYPAVHAVMSGAVNNAVVDVEEFLVARDSDLVILQFRYPRGVDRDSIGRGYARSLHGLRFGGPSAVDATPTSRRAVAATEWSVSLDRRQVVFDLPAEQRAAAPGQLTSEIVADGRRTMRFTPLVGPADSSHYAVGRFQVETRRAGRLVIRIWRNAATDPSLVHVSDSLIRSVSRIWARYWSTLGPVPTNELALVETAWPETEGAPGMLFVGVDASDSRVLWRELSRTWFGGVVSDAGEASVLVGRALPAWAASMLADSGTADTASDVHVIELVRASAGEARFREALRTLLMESRGGPAAIPAFRRVLGDTASVPLLPLVR